MHDVTIVIEPPNASALGDNESALRVWRDVSSELSSRSSIFVVGRNESNWFGVSVDASQVIRYLNAEIHRVPAESNVYAAMGDLALELSIEPSGDIDAGIQFPLNRFVEQLFLACNLACPGSCEFSRGRIRLNPSLIEGPFYLGRIMEDESPEPTSDYWPELKPVTFREAWAWLQEDLSYDVEVAESPAQMAIFSLLFLANRNPEDPDNLLAIARAVESIFGRGVKENITKTLQTRIENHFGSSPQFPKWFREFYDLRSRLIHGGRIIRPGLTVPHSREGRAFLDSHLGAVEHGVRLLLAAIYEMIRSNRRELNLKAE